LIALCIDNNLQMALTARKGGGGGGEEEEEEEEAHEQVNSMGRSSS
jgi:hypothetical protein